MTLHLQYVSSISHLKYILTMLAIIEQFPSMKGRMVICWQCSACPIVHPLIYEMFPPPMIQSGQYNSSEPKHVVEEVLLITLIILTAMVTGEEGVVPIASAISMSSRKQKADGRSWSIINCSPP